MTNEERDAMWQETRDAAYAEGDKCEECGVTNPQYGHRDYCSQSETYDVTLIAPRRKPE